MHETIQSQLTTDHFFTGECETKIDAVIYLQNGDLYFMRKHLVWKYDSTADHVEVNYPKEINEEFPSVSGTKIPSDLDCASRYKNENGYINLYFVKGDQVYVYDVKTKTLTVKSTAQFWPSQGAVTPIPTNVPVTVSITGYPVGTWIFKDDLVWKYDDFHARNIRSGYPKNITATPWNGLPKDVDDGFFDPEKSKYYFFRGTRYFENNFKNFFANSRSKTKPYVREIDYIHKKWKGICSAKY